MTAMRQYTTVRTRPPRYAHTISTIAIGIRHASDTGLRAATITSIADSITVAYIEVTPASAVELRAFTYPCYLDGLAAT